MELTAARADVPAILESDVCVVGAGPAGLTLAQALEDGARVVLIESGGRTADAAVQELNAGATHGDAYADLRTSRYRQVGGTANVWNTFWQRERGAKYAPLDPGDLVHRPWVPHSGWPFRWEELEPWYRRAQDRCGLGGFDYGGDDSLPELRQAGLRRRFTGSGRRSHSPTRSPASCWRRPRSRCSTVRPSRRSSAIMMHRA